ncbi:Gfo/Idh/MocA family protein [Marinivivus vitaminiproducens]|uniref:Gfo/Idh/MocA family protein n=1 Tax=Marinivivus vitaminiproducens TaxID=3035935 RepID=UPI0027AA8E26|nr:Gfo/Idh/MocA family oxidoreductase [Geminicoccaceae bacterium SCSIO 64248]
MASIKLGIIGCGNISDAYFKGAARSSIIAVKACTDLLPEAAKSKAETYGVAAASMEGLLDDPEIDIVINLTVPMAHADVTQQVIAAGKHVYSEKPFAVTVAEARPLVEAAAAKGVRIGSAPDTFLGAGHQAVRRAIDKGTVGQIVAGAATFAGPGMESWHPNPGFFFRKGGGPVLDIGAYPVTQLVNCLGPVASVTAQASKGRTSRMVTSEPRRGEVIEVEVPTTVNAVLLFESGANVSVTLSWDMWKHNRLPIELYGTEGSLLNPDPNFFGGTPRFTEKGGDWQDLSIDAHPFGIPNREMRSGAMVADYRIIGVLDMAEAIRAGRPHRANGDLALHVLEVLGAMEASALEERHIRIESRCERPAVVPFGEGEEVFSRAA